MKKILFYFVVPLLLLFACTKEPDNPYDEVNYNTDTSTSSSPDPTTIVGLHKNIFLPRCAYSGCHDGTFEPDYRTVQSTYTTLVYQPVIKTTLDSANFFRLRVIPFNPDSSFLVERITTPTTEYMPSNGNRLSSTDINYIRTWILNGAKDQDGQVPVAPDLPPIVTGFVAVDQLNLTVQIDTNRLNDVPYNPFIVHPGQNIYISFAVTDDSTSYANLTTNQLKLSYDEDDFSNATTVDAINLLGYWLVPVSANNYTPNDTVFFRYYVNDGNHPSPTEFPRDDYPFYYKWYCSFIVQ